MYFYIFTCTPCCVCVCVCVSVCVCNQLRHMPLDISVMAFPGWMNCRKEDPPPSPAEKDLALSRSSPGMRSEEKPVLLAWLCILLVSVSVVD